MPPVECLSVVGPGEIGPVEHGAAVAHRLGERDAFVERHVAEIDRHGEGGGLGVGHGAIGEAGDEVADFAGRQRLAVALPGDDFLGEKRHSQSSPSRSSRTRVRAGSIVISAPSLEVSQRWSSMCPKNDCAEHGSGVTRRDRSWMHAWLGRVPRSRELTPKSQVVRQDRREPFSSGVPNEILIRGSRIAY